MLGIPEVRSAWLRRSGVEEGEKHRRVEILSNPPAPHTFAAKACWQVFRRRGGRL